MADESLATATVKIRPDTTGFRTELDEKLRASLADDNVDVRVNADTGVANAELDRTEAKARELDGKTANVKVRVHEDTTNGGISLLGLLAGFTPALGTVGTVATGVLGGLTAGFATATAGAGAFAAVAIPTIKETLKQQDALTKAQQAYNSATTDKARAKALEDEQKILSGLNAQQQQFLLGWTSLKQQFSQVQQVTAPAVFTVAADALKVANPLIAALPGLVYAVSPAFQSLEQSAQRALSGPGFHEFVNFIQVEAPTDIKQLGEAFGNFGVGLARSLEGVAPLIHLSLGGLNDLASAFAHADMGPNSGLGQFVTYVQRNGPLVGHTLADIAGAVTGLLRAVSPLGPPLLQVIDGLAEVIKQGIPTVREIVGDITPAVKGLGTVLHDIAPILGPIAADIAAIWLAFKGYEIVKSATSALKDFALIQTVLGAGSAVGGTAAAAGGAAAAEGAAAGGGLLSGALGVVSAAAVPVGAGLLGYQLGAAQASSRQNKHQTAFANYANQQLAGTDQNDPAQLYTLLSNLRAESAKVGDLSGKGAADQVALFDKLNRQYQAVQVNAKALSQQTDLTEKSVEGLATSAGINLGGSLQEVSAKFNTVYGAMASTGASAKTLGQIFDDLGSKDLVKAAEGINEYFDTFTSKSTAAIHSQDAFTEALRGTKLNLDKNSLALSSNTDGAIANRNALEGLVDQTKAHIADLERTGAPAKTVTDAFRSMHDQVLNLAGSNKQARAELQTMLDTMEGSPAQFEAFYAAAVASKQSPVEAMATLQQAIKDVANTKFADPLIRQFNDIYAAAGNVSGEVKDLANSLHETIVQLGNDAAAAAQANADPQAYLKLHPQGHSALGGPIGYVTGPGTGTSDSVPWLVSNGEYVVRASEATKYRQVLDAINYGRPVFADMPGMTRQQTPTKIVNAPVTIQAANASPQQVAQYTRTYLDFLAGAS